MRPYTRICIFIAEAINGSYPRNRLKADVMPIHQDMV